MLTLKVIGGLVLFDSIKEDNCNQIVDKIFQTANSHSCSIIYPEDVAVGKSFEDKSQIVINNKALIANNENISLHFKKLYITIRNFSSYTWLF